MLRCVPDYLYYFYKSQHGNTGEALGSSEENRMQRFDFDIGGFEYSIAVYDGFYR